MGECLYCVIVYDKLYEDLIEEVMILLNKFLMINLLLGYGKYKMVIFIGV